MNVNAEQLLTRALELPDSERADLAAALIASLDQRADPDTAEAWDEEIVRRLAEVDSGQVTMVPWPEVRQMLSGHADDPTGR